MNNMSASSSGSYNARTYGGRFGIKRKQAGQLSEPVYQGDVVHKRRKVSVEPFVRTPSPGSPAKTEEDIERDLKLSPLLKPKPKVTVTYGSPGKRNSSPLAPLSPSPGKPAKPARDFSSIFDSIVPSSTPPPSPSKLAKRMLARSKTESSMGTQASTHDNSLDRTPSLPNLPSSPSSRSDAHTQLSTAIIPNVKSSTTKTYAGSFRSFLVPLPVANTSNLVSQGMENRDDEFDSRESYSSLRSRWGVDNSEDDPYPDVPLASASNSASPNVSPSKRRLKTSLEAPIGTMNPLKSISELRNKGETRRFLDEIGYLFEGMDKSGGIGLRRASALQITTKLCEAEFVRKAKAVDFFSRTWDAFLDAGAGKGEDVILDIILVFFAALAARDTSILSDLAQRSPTSSSLKEDDDLDGHGSFVGSLFQVLEIVISQHDPLLLVSSKSDIGSVLIKKAGINKRDFETVKTIHQTILSKSHLFSPDIQISTPLLIMYSLHSISPSDIPMSHLPTLLSSLRLSLEVAGPAASLISALHRQWRDASNALSYEIIYYHLQMLEAYLSNQWESPPSKGSQGHEDINDNAMEMARDEWLVDDLIALGVCTELELQSQEDPIPIAAVQKCLECLLRILVNLTHANELWGRKVVQCDYAMNFLLRIIHNSSQSMVQRHGDMVKIEEEEEGLDARNDDKSVERAETCALDTLYLTLGLLTNLVQAVKEAKEAVRETRLNPSCALKKRACARRCTCSPTSNGLDILVNIYTIQGFKIESSESSLPADVTEAFREVDASFLHGHLAVLFGLLMSESPENQSAILESLPIPTSAATTSSRVQKNKTGNKVKLSRLAEQARDFVAVYATVSAHSKEGEKGSKVAKSVVRFLEKQRDAAS